MPRAVRVMRERIFRDVMGVPALQQGFDLGRAGGRFTAEVRGAAFRPGGGARSSRPAPAAAEASVNRNAVAS